MARPAGTITLALLVAAGLIPPAGCLKRCTETDLNVTSVTASANSPLVLQATLTANNKPVVGASITFYSETTGPSGPSGRRIATRRTDDQGFARLDLPLGLTELQNLPGERATGYTAKFRPLNKIGDRFYCKSRSTVGEIRQV